MHEQSSTACFNPLTSFLHDITNNNTLIQENKENIHPALLGKLSAGVINNNSNNNNDGCGSRSGLRNGNCTIMQQQQQQQQINTSLMSDCYTPVMNRYRPQHTGLTPGNNPVRQSRGGASYSHVNMTDISFLAESDVRDAKNNSFFLTPEKQCNVAALSTIIGAADAVAATTDAISPTSTTTTTMHSNTINTASGGLTQPIKISEFFQECAPIAHSASSPNMSLESILLPKSVLLESDNDDDDNESVLEEQPGKRPRTVENFTRRNANHVIPITSVHPSSQEQQEQTLLLQQQQQEQQKVLPQQKLQSVVAPAPLLFAAPQPVAHYATISHNVPPPEYPRNEMPSTITRVVSTTAPLIAVGGRRVPLDKLHILLRPSTPEQMSNNGNDITFTGNKTGVSAPLIPSARPIPAAVKMVSPSLSSATVAPVASSSSSSSTHPIKRRPPYRQHETVILEFARGVQMRFKSNSTRCVPVVGRHYIASVRSSRSPYDNVAYEDAGVCVQVQRHHAYSSSSSNINTIATGESVMCDEKGIYDGHIMRELVAADATRIRELEETRNTALTECRKHFLFLNLPFELMDVYCTFDRSICVVYYAIQPQEGTSGQPNVSRLLRMLQFRLQSKVYLKTVPSSE
ncbi:PSP1 [Trypanosoma melophagium]|uniref:PSP1 n=1 Tax=Trypanosoma melophagium TaxID=715481 RepID=UPI00351A97A7|nr:PSP1 [Trypanosoma melophagium]